MRTMKTTLTALSALALLPLGLLAAGCGSGDTAASGSDTASVGRQATPVAVASPRPAQCGQPTYADTPWAGDSAGNGMWLFGAIYISCVGEPIMVRAADVDRGDWRRGQPSEINGADGTGPGTAVRPGAFLVSDFACNSRKASWGWQMGITLADGSKASVRVQLAACGNTNAVRARFNTDEGQGLTSAVITTETGKRLRVVGERNTSLPGLKYPDGKFAKYMPIYIKAA